MRYEGNVYRPPSEANSLILQITIGCAHNLCTFCNMYKNDKFNVRKTEEIFQDLDWAKTNYRHIKRLFLADGDALVLKNDKLLEIMNYARKTLPELERISLYGCPKDVLRKDHEELLALKEQGLEIIYMGGESGSDEILKNIKKGVNSQELIEAIRKIEEAGIKASVTFISGLAGKDKWREHAIETAKVISMSEPSYVGLLTLMVEPGTELFTDINNGKFQLLTAQEILDETELLIENITVKKSCVFRSNHASNYLSLKGDLPKDKEAMLSQIKIARDNTYMLKNESFRLL